MKNLVIIFLVFAAFSAQAQKFFTKTGMTEFEASVEAFEPVEAKNNSTTAVLNASTGDVAALLFVKAFHFRVALMEEHFNENYMDSDKHPKATFKGKIEDFDIAKLNSEAQTFNLSGTLTIKGKSKEINTTIDLKTMDGKIHANSDFSVSPQDFDIEIPSIVRKKIAQSIKITFDYELSKK